MLGLRDTAKLVEEIGRYLATVDLFRALGCEPTWRPESPCGAALPTPIPLPELRSSDVHLH